MQRFDQLPHIPGECHVVYHPVQDGPSFVTTPELLYVLDDSKTQTVHVPVRVPRSGHGRVPKVVDVGYPSPSSRVETGRTCPRVPPDRLEGSIDDDGGGVH